MSANTIKASYLISQEEAADTSLSARTDCMALDP